MSETTESGWTKAQQRAATSSRASEPILCYDGMGTLAAELCPAPEDVVIEPSCGAVIALVERLSPQQASQILRELFSEEKTRSPPMPCASRDSGFTELRTALFGFALGAVAFVLIYLIAPSFF